MASAYEEAILALIAAASSPKTNVSSSSVQGNQWYSNPWNASLQEFGTTGSTQQTSTTSMQDKEYANQLLASLSALRQEQVANDPLTAIMSQMTGEYDKGQANFDLGKSDYSSLPALFQQRQSEIMGLLDNQGQQQSADISSRFNQQKSTTSQDLASRGLGNTTVRSSAMQGLSSAESAEQRRLGETLTNQKVGAMTGLSGDYLKSIADRGQSYMDLGARYPSLIDLGNIALQYGKSSNDRSSIPVRSLLGS